LNNRKKLTLADESLKMSVPERLAAQALGRFRITWIILSGK